MTAPDREPPGHYFSESPTTPSRPSSITVRARGDEFALTTDRATFSPRRLDPGTAFLLGEAPDPPAAGTFLDLGCGYGPIAAALARARPDAIVHAIDVNERSRALCAENARTLGLDAIMVSTPDDVPANTTFDLIWSNPPIRIGKDALHKILSQWLVRLTPDGSAVLVVGRHLGADSLQRWLTTEGFPTTRLASRKGYRLLHTRRGD